MTADVALSEDPRGSEIVELRRKRFFGAGGICDRYERTDDELIQAWTIAGWLEVTVPGLNRDDVIQRFSYSAKHGGFGLRQYGPDRRAVARLVDLDSFGSFARAQYALRPSTLTVAIVPQLMRASRSDWVEWIRSQGWQVPIELDRAVNENSPAPSATTQGAPVKPVLRADIDGKYQARRDEFRDKGRYPTIAQDETWRKENQISRARTRKLRGDHLPPKKERNGRPKAAPKN